MKIFPILFDAVPEPTAKAATGIARRDWLLQSSVALALFALGSQTQAAVETKVDIDGLASTLTQPEPAGVVEIVRRTAGPTLRDLVLRVGVKPHRDADSGRAPLREEACGDGGIDSSGHGDEDGSGHGQVAYRLRMRKTTASRALESV